MSSRQQNSITTNSSNALLFNGMPIAVKNVSVSDVSNIVAVGTNINPTVQSGNSIVLNASGTSLRSQNSGFFVAPITNTVQGSVLGYNKNTNEITNILGYIQCLWKNRSNR